MTGTEMQDPIRIPDSAKPAVGQTASRAIDPEDPDVVPVALTAFVAAARYAHAAISVNGYYTARIAVAAIEDVVAALVRITAQVAPYAGDVSTPSGKVLTHAESLLVEARAGLSDARHHLYLDEESDAQPEILEGQPLPV